MDAGREKIFRRLTTGELEKLIEDGTVSGGMIPKIASSLQAVKHGVEQATSSTGTRGTTSSSSSSPMQVSGP
jgi:acetylglutamate kinase